MAVQKQFKFIICKKEKTQKLEYMIIQIDLKVKKEKDWNLVEVDLIKLVS